MWNQSDKSYFSALTVSNNNSNNYKISPISTPISIPSTHPENEPTETEVVILEEFKRLVNCTLDIPREYLTDDYFYLKWLRARRYNLEKSKEMLLRHLEWRKSCRHLDGIMDYNPPADAMEQYRWKQIGIDSAGRPVYCVIAGIADIQYLIENNHIETTFRYAHKLLEVVQQESNQHRRKFGNGKAIGIADLRGFTFKKAMYGLQFFHYAIYFARVFEANYPETLYRGYALNTNWLCVKLYNMIKPFLSQETIDKLHIFGNDQSKYLPVLQSTIPIDVIPIDFGGEGESMAQYFQLNY